MNRKKDATNDRSACYASHPKEDDMIRNRGFSCVGSSFLTDRGIKAAINQSLRSVNDIVCFCSIRHLIRFFGIALISFSALADTVPTPQDFCYMEASDRRTRALAALTELEIKDYVRKAEAGDVQAMSLLAKVPKKDSNGKPDADFNTYWLRRAIDAGDKMLDLRERRNAAIKDGHWDEFIKATEMETLKAFEASALNGDEPSAIALARAYRRPSDYGWSTLTPDIEKSLYWYRFASSLGSRQAPVMLCELYFIGLKTFGYEGEPNYQEAAHWCVQAAHVSCDAGPALHLSTMFAKGLGVPKNIEQALYWRQVGGDRLERDGSESIYQRVRELKYR